VDGAAISGSGVDGPLAAAGGSSGGGARAPELQALLARRLQWVVEQVDDVDRCVMVIVIGSIGGDQSVVCSKASNYHTHTLPQRGPLPRATGPGGRA
jgi:hypothetical protein